MSELILRVEPRRRASRRLEVECQNKTEKGKGIRHTSSGLKKNGGEM